MKVSPKKWPMPLAAAGQGQLRRHVGVVVVLTAEFRTKV